MKSKYLCIECHQPLASLAHACPGRCQGRRINRAKWEQASLNHAQALCDAVNHRRALAAQEVGK